MSSERSEFHQRLEASTFDCIAADWEYELRHGTKGDKGDKGRKEVEPRWRRGGERGGEGSVRGGERGGNESREGRGRGGSARRGGSESRGETRKVEYVKEVKQERREEKAQRDQKVSRSEDVFGEVASTTDKHTLYVKTGLATVEQINQAFKTTLNLIDDIDGCMFRVNQPVNNKGENFRFAYVYISEEKAFNVIIGLNPDGTERASYTDDPTWVPPPPHPHPTMADSWGDLEDEEDEQKPRQIKTALDPLIPAPSYLMNDQQLTEAIKYAKQIGQAGADEEGGGGSSGVDRREFFSVTAAFVSPLPNHVNPCVLKSSKLPPTVSAEFLCDIFSGYSHNENFPIVNMDSDFAFVAFNPESSDAQFALLMMKRYTDDTIGRIIYFDHASNKEYDRINLRYGVRKQREANFSLGPNTSTKTPTKPPPKNKTKLRRERRNKKDVNDDEFGEEGGSRGGRGGGRGERGNTGRGGNRFNHLDI